MVGAASTLERAGPGNGGLSSHADAGRSARGSAHDLAGPTDAGGGTVEGALSGGGNRLLDSWWWIGWVWSGSCRLVVVGVCGGAGRNGMSFFCF